jgi:hypothetical protein
VDPDIVQSRVIISLSGFENKVFLLRRAPIPELVR